MGKVFLHPYHPSLPGLWEWCEKEEKNLLRVKAGLSMMAEDEAEASAVTPRL